MNAVKIFRITIVFWVFFAVGLPQTSLARYNGIADFLCEYATELYDRGNYKDAKHEFTKALMVDPGNRTARLYLKKIARHYPRPPMTLEEQYAILTQELFDSRENAANLKDILDQYKKRANHQETYLNEKDDEIIRLEGDMTELKDVLHQNDKELRDARHAQRFKLLELEHNYRQLRHTAFKESAQYAKALAALRGKLYHQKHKEEDLKTAAFQKDIEILKQDDRLLDRDNRIMQLHETISANDAYHAAYLKQKISEIDRRLLKTKSRLQDKSDEVTALKAQIIEMTREFARKQSMLEGHQEAAVLTLLPSQEQEKVSARQAQMEETIARLQEKLRDAQEEMAAIKSGQKQGTIDAYQKLRETLAESELELIQQKMNLADKDREILALRGRVNDLGERLNLAQEIIRKKDEKIEELQKAER